MITGSTSRAATTTAQHARPNKVTTVAAKSPKLSAASLIPFDEEAKPQANAPTKQDFSDFSKAA